MNDMRDLEGSSSQFSLDHSLAQVDSFQTDCTVLPLSVERGSPCRLFALTTFHLAAHLRRTVLPRQEAAASESAWSDL